MSSSSPHDPELIAAAFLLELDGGEVLHPLLESYSEQELLSNDEEIAAGERIEGFVYYEAEIGSKLSYAAFDCSNEEDGEGLWLRWKLAAEPDLGRESREKEQDHYDLIISSTGPDPRRIARIISEETGEDPASILARLSHFPTVVASGVSFATAE
jgi:hypothetical protein